ncbi:AGE family epimerase/isomerase [Sinomonas susongensis]|uniref:AGE family epimerase/isomerase n=1 Tax=Sinomonas susongensis TaxID=1324851 RepID=UPI001BB2744F|nr:AGE family epimerase/isomerase [Sinomonas susongensis]
MAVATARFLQDHTLLPGPVVAYRTSVDGRPLPSGRNGELAVSVLADLFAALGLAGAARVPGAATDERSQWLQISHALLRHARERISSRTAPSEPYPVRAGFTDAAGFMLLLNVGAELHRSSGSSESAETAEWALDQLLGDGSDGSGMWRRDAWWEYRPDDDGDRDTLLARHRTPGHLLEMTWMVADAAEAIPSLGPRIPAWLPDLAVRALELGWDQEYGGIFRYVDADGGQPRGRLFGDDRYEVLVQRTWDTKLWWVHVEALYATQRLAAEFDRADLREWRDRLCAYTLDTFPEPRGGEWTQIRDRHGRPLDEVVALPVKDPFHIARALLLITELDSERNPL